MAESLATMVSSRLVLGFHSSDFIIPNFILVLFKSCSSRLFRYIPHPSQNSSCFGKLVGPYNFWCMCFVYVSRYTIIYFNIDIKTKS
jgi:hypothetical protein